MTEKPRPRYDVFVSYEEKTGLDFAVHLKETLKKKGVRAYVAQENAREDWRSSIDNAIKGCKHFVVIITELACSSTEVKREIELAQSLGKDIIPCKHEDTPRSLTSKLSFLDRIQQLDFDTKEDLARGVLIKIREPRIREEVTKLVPRVFSSETYGALRARKLNDIIESVYPPFCQAGEEMCKLMFGADGDELSALRLKFLRDNEGDLIKILDAAVGIGASYGLVCEVYDHIAKSIRECEGFSGKESTDQAMLKINRMQYEIFNAVTCKRTIRKFLRRIGKHDILIDLDEIPDIYSLVTSIKNALKDGTGLCLNLHELEKTKEHLVRIEDAIRNDLDAETEHLDMITPVVRDLYDTYGIDEKDLIAVETYRTFWQ